jgi:hypothetical protein
MSKLIVAFRNFANAPKNVAVIESNYVKWVCKEWIVCTCWCLYLSVERDVRVPFKNVHVLCWCRLSQIYFKYWHINLRFGIMILLKLICWKLSVNDDKYFAVIKFMIDDHIWVLMTNVLQEN